MKPNIFAYLFALLILISLNSKAQDSTVVNYPNSNTIGIPITKNEFDKKIANYTTLMGKWTRFNTVEYVDMVRLYNTIGGSGLMEKNFYRTYYTVFFIMYVKIAAEVLGASPSKGMALYSEKYKIWIGDKPLGNNNSRFKIDTTK
jgi:hypothetical protein